MKEMNSLLAFGAGLVGGWALRSLADSPQGVGVKLLEAAITTKDRLGRWAAVEQERLEDMMAEAHAKMEQSESAAKVPTNGHGAAHGKRRRRGPVHGPKAEA